MKRAAHVAVRLRRWIVILAAMLVAIASSSLASAPPDGAPASLTEYRCYDCHRDRESVAGPAFAEIAASYRGKRDAAAKIAAEIRYGIRGGGPWHMPPHPEVSASEAKAIARYILSLDSTDAAAQGTGRR